MYFNFSYCAVLIHAIYFFNKIFVLFFHFKLIVNLTKYYVLISTYFSHSEAVETSGFFGPATATFLRELG